MSLSVNGIATIRIAQKCITIIDILDNVLILLLFIHQIIRYNKQNEAQFNTVRKYIYQAASHHYSTDDYFVLR